MFQRFFRIAILPVITVTIIGCTAKKSPLPPADWPQYVVSNLWIPKTVKSLKDEPRTPYMVIFQADTCYPAKKLIDDLVDFMTARGWKRLISDPLNPSIKVPLNHARGISGEWGSGLDENMLEFYDWREFWKDEQGNIIEYRLEYKLNHGEKIDKACSLAGFSMYTSEDLLREILKAIHERENSKGNIIEKR